MISTAWTPTALDGSSSLLSSHLRSQGPIAPSKSQMLPGQWGSQSLLACKEKSAFGLAQGYSLALDWHCAPCFVRENQDAMERRVTWGPGTQCSILVLLLPGQLYDPGNTPEPNFPIHKAILYTVATSSAPHKNSTNGANIPHVSVECPAVAAYLTQNKIQLPCGGQQGPTGSCLQPITTPHPLPLSLCSFCHCHTGLLTVPQTHQEDSYPRAFAFAIFSACMLFPQIFILFAFLLHDDVCLYVTFLERSFLSTVLKKKKNQYISLYLLSHFSLSLYPVLSFFWVLITLWYTTYLLVCLCCLSFYHQLEAPWKQVLCLAILWLRTVPDILYTCKKYLSWQCYLISYMWGRWERGWVTWSRMWN